MKLIGNLLMTVTLLVGLLAAATSYLAPVSAPADSWTDYINTSGETEYIHSNNPAGAERASAEDIARLRTQYENGEITAQQFLASSERLNPVLAGDEQVTPEALAALQANELVTDGETRKVQYVNVKRFSPFGWPYWWAFALSAVGLFAGSMMVRTASKREIAAHAAEGGTEGAKPRKSPLETLAEIRMGIDKLRADLPNASSDKDRTHLIVDRIGAMQKNQLSDFVDARPVLIGKMGLGGYAELMDRFAAAERQINRSWSIAADGFYAESAECLENAAHLLVETQEKMA